MAQGSAIAGVTLALRDVLERAFRNGNEPRPADVLVTTLPVDRARSVHHRPQANLMLVSALPQASLRPGGPPGLRGAAPGPAPLPQVDLLYLLTTYGPDDDEVGAHRVMGVAMQALSASPVLGPLDLAALSPDAGLIGVIEQVRVTQVALTREQIAAWWLAFHTPYRLTTAWQVTLMPDA